MYCRCKHWRSCPSSDKSKHFAFKQRLYWAMSDAQISTQPVVTFTSFWCDWQQPLRLITSVAFAFCVSLNVGSVSRASFRSFEHFAAPDFVIRPAEVRRAGEQRRAQKISSDAVVVGGRVDDSLVCGRVKGRRRCSFVIRAVLTASEWPATAADSTARGSQRGPRIPRCLAVRSELSAALCWHRSLARSLARSARHKWGAVKSVIYWFSERRRSPAIWPPCRKDTAPPPRPLPSPCWTQFSARVSWTDLRPNDWTTSTSLPSNRHWTDRAPGSQAQRSTTPPRSCPSACPPPVEATPARESVYRRSPARIGSATANARPSAVILAQL